MIHCCRSNTLTPTRTWYCPGWISRMDGQQNQIYTTCRVYDHIVENLAGILLQKHANPWQQKTDFAFLSYSLLWLTRPLPKPSREQDQFGLAYRCYYIDWLSSNRYKNTVLDCILCIIINPCNCWSFFCNFMTFYEHSWIQKTWILICYEMCASIIHHIFLN